MEVIDFPSRAGLVQPVVDRASRASNDKGKPFALPGQGYAARVDQKNDVYVDVENATRSDIRVTSLLVLFHDKRKLLIEESTIECHTDCRVGRADAESFGPIEVPGSWDTVKVMDVYYEDDGEEEADEETAPPPLLKPESLDGYAEWRRDGLLIVDGQRVRLAASGKFKGSRNVSGFAQIPLGYEVKVKGRRASDGAPKEWNAMAAPNDSLYVFSGLLADLDDDEVAIVLGHELAHATHEHSRKQFKKDMLIQLAALGVVAVAEETVKDKNKRAVLQVAALLGASAWTSGYGRSHEDQADRVGLRYANEGGFDVGKGPGLWNRFAKKYGDSPKVLNFFFGDHSVAQDRAKNLTRELELNYRR